MSCWQGSARVTISLLCPGDVFLGQLRVPQLLLGRGARCFTASLPELPAASPSTYPRSLRDLMAKGRGVQL